MEIRQLRYFVAVAEHLNFTEASKQLFVAQSTVSHQIAVLEKEIGVKLLIRNKRTVTLTKEGVAFLKDALETIDHAEIAVRRARQVASGVNGCITIGFLSPVSGVRLFISEVIKKFHQLYPNIEIEIKQNNVEGLSVVVADGGLDLAFTLAFPNKRNIPGVVWEKLFSDRSCLVVHSEHYLADKTSINIASLKEERFILMSRQESPEGFDFLIRLFGEHGFSPHIVSTVPSVESMLLLVEAGLGIAIAPKFAQEYKSSKLRFIEIEGDAGSYDVQMIWYKNNNTPCLPIFLQEIRKELCPENNLEIGNIEPSLFIQ